jgi:hypothetical protein
MNSVNAQIKDDYHLGYTLAHDTKKLTKCEGVLALKDKRGDFFLKSECLKRVLTVGCHHTVGGDNDNLNAYEIIYDYAEKPELKGIKGYPIGARVAGTRKIDNVVLKGKVEVDKDVKAYAAVTQKFNKNLKFVASEEINLTNMYEDASKHSYKFGVSVTWSI